MAMSTTSGMMVGQSRFKAAATSGISSGRRPRKPLRLASRCTWMNTPKKCMKAGTIAARMIVL
jgi:hypothetical protein